MGIMHISGHIHQIQQKEMSKFFDYKYSKNFNLSVWEMAIEKESNDKSKQRLQSVYHRTYL